MSSDIVISKALWGRSETGDNVHIYTLTAPNGTEVAISDLGGTLLHWLARDRTGKLANMVLGFDTPEEYLQSDTHMSGLIGRWANRIADARFSIDGRQYVVEANDGANSLHGGTRGFDRHVWHATPIDGGLTLRHRSPDGDGGFPGQVDVCVEYRFDANGMLRVDYEAETTAPTPISLTHHAYFNLAGTGTALDHVIRIAADSVLLTDEGNIPTSQIPVDGTAFDFRQGSTIRASLESGEPAIRSKRGIDHCFVLGDPMVGYVPLRQIASVVDPISGRRLTVSTTERAVQLYTGANLEGLHGKAGLRHLSHDAFCLETQALPNQMNGDYAEAAILRPGQTYRQTTVFQIDAD